MTTTWEDRVFLGQTVLSLTGQIGNDSKSHAESASGRHHVAFNGEIYNFRSLAERWIEGRTRISSETTDTEVLANLHDFVELETVPELLDGMYAYALLDRDRRRLVLGRDVQGEKSVYVYEDDRRIILASEIPAILALAPAAGEIDPQALRDYFRTRHFMRLTTSAYKGIRQVAPGHLEVLDLDALTWSVASSRSLVDWIDAARFEANERRSPEDLADELDQLLIQSIREMMPREHGYAAVVSGGIDSSIVGHHLVEHGAPELLVAVDHIGKDLIASDLSGFERSLGRPIDVLHIDEVPYAAEIARCQQICGGPLPSHSFVPQALQAARVRAAGCRIMFGGEGGDELFGGYAAYLDQNTPIGRFSPSPYMACVTPEVVFAEDDPRAIEAELAGAWADALAAYAFVEAEHEQIALASMCCDALYQLPAVGLRSADLMSMMWSVEARAVLVRRPIVEFALNLPYLARLAPNDADPNLRTKVLLKRLFLRYFGPELMMPKQGFAGFPNESAAYLGDPADYLIYNALGIDRSPSTEWSRDAHWKIANVEYFLRSQPEIA